MITRSEIMPLLLQACPSFEATWEEYRANELFDPTLTYPSLGEFAVHLIGLWRAGRTVELAHAFSAIERLHVDGDHFVREAATIGLLEGIQNMAEHAGLDPEVFRRFLGPESERWWDALNRFWAGESPLVQLEPPDA